MVLNITGMSALYPTIYKNRMLSYITKQKRIFKIMSQIHAVPSYHSDNNILRSIINFKAAVGQ